VVLILLVMAMKNEFVFVKPQFWEGIAPSCGSGLRIRIPVMVYTGIGYLVNIEPLLICKPDKVIGCGSGPGSGPATRNDPLPNAEREEDPKFSE
jgi:hypothetical protein